MAVLKKTGTALILCVLAVLLSSLWNVNRHLGRLAETAEDIWEAHNGVEDQIEGRIDYCAQLWSVTRDLHGADAFRDAYNALYEAEEHGSAADMAKANRELTAAAEALHPMILAASRDTEDAEYYYGLQRNAARVMETAAADYNAAVADYAAVTDSFPLTLLRPLIFVEAPVPFE